MIEPFGRICELRREAMSSSLTHPGGRMLRPRIRVLLNSTSPQPSRSSGRISRDMAAMFTVCVLLAGRTCSPVAAADESLESRYLHNVRQLTSDFVKAGEGYFSPDAKTIIYQAVLRGYPFYQIYTQTLGWRRAADGEHGPRTHDLQQLPAGWPQNHLRLKPFGSAAVRDRRGRTATPGRRRPHRASIAATSGISIPTWTFSRPTRMAAT